MTLAAARPRRCLCTRHRRSLGVPMQEITACFAAAVGRCRRRSVASWGYGEPRGTHRAQTTSCVRPVRRLRLHLDANSANLLRFPVDTQSHTDPLFLLGVLSANAAASRQLRNGSVLSRGRRRPSPCMSRRGECLACEPPSEQARCRGEKDGLRFRFPSGASQGGVDVLDEVGVFHVARLGDDLAPRLHRDVLGCA